MSSAAATSAAHIAAAAAPSAAAPAAQPQAPMPTRLLSIQSSVVYGYVGNKASNFPLQLLGFDVDPIHSCQFSNHTGYGVFSGVKTTAAECKLITKGLKDNAFLQRYTHLLTGYMSSVEFLEESVLLIQELKQLRPDLLYACDPVMGDNGALYVPSAFVGIYRDSLLKLADIVTPNQTEAELLSGIPITDAKSAYANLCWFHARGVRTVIITSMKFGDHAAAQADEQPIQVMASTVADLSNPYPSQCAHMQFRKIPFYFSGTGDLSTALLLGWLVKSRSTESSSASASAPASSGVFSFPSLVRALELTMSTVQAVIERTAKAQSEELLLIQSKDDIERPPTTQSASVLDATQWASDLKATNQAQ